MWVGHVKGWLSIAEHRRKPKHLLVRARRARHISSLWGEADVYFDPDADYPYRAVIERDVVARVLADYIKEIDYDAFKPAVKEPELREAFNHMWYVLYQYGVEFR